MNTENKPSTLDERIREIEVLNNKAAKNVSDPQHLAFYFNELRDIAVEQAKEIDAFRTMLSDRQKMIDGLKTIVYATEDREAVLKAEIDRLTRFIPVGERLPDAFERVKVKHGDGGSLGYWDGMCWWDNDGGDIFNVTEWREI